MGGGVMRHWNRGRKTVRNFLLAFLLAVLLYAALGFPPYTVRGMCLRFQHDYLLEDLEPLYVQHTAREKNLRARTLILARSGETYAIFRYSNHSFLQNQLDMWVKPEIREGGAGMVRGMAIYAAGPFREAASATATVRLEKWEDGVLQRTRDFTLEGERLAESAFRFPLGDETGWQSLTFWESYLRIEDFPEDDQAFLQGQEMPPSGEMEDLLGLKSLAELWYREESGGNAYSLPDVELPCTVTLYGETGAPLTTLKLTIRTTGLWSWY